MEENAEVSRRTLYKHADIWRKDYEDLAAGFFASCVHEYNAVVEAASPKSEPPSILPEKFVPSGLLAARRVVAELAMRTQRDLRRSVRTKEFASNDSNQAWRSKVAELTSDFPSALSIGEIRARLFVLPEYLQIAPYEEDAITLLPYIQQLRRELIRRVEPPRPCPEQ